MKPKPYIFVVGNEKGGAGKTTCSMHLIVSLLYKGFKVGSIDTDSRQHSLTSYMENRRRYNDYNPDYIVPMPYHYHIKQFSDDSESNRNLQDALNRLESEVDYVVIDTPGSHTAISALSHSYADTIITPINDSFLDLDVLAKIDPESLNVVSPSTYSAAIWEYKMQKARRGGAAINWVVVRNRLSSLDAANKRRVGEALEKLSKRISFTIADGFSERVIFRELFLEGLTLLDIKKANYNKPFSVSHVAARQELREFLNVLKVQDS